MNIHVARNGEIIGEFPEDIFRDKVFRGEVRSDDHYWRPGMDDWETVASYRANTRTQVIRRDLPRDPKAG